MSRLEFTLEEAGATLDDGRRASTNASDMTSAMAGAMSELSTAAAVQVLGVQPFAALAPRFAENQTFRERFRAEAHMIAALHHPNIIEVYDLDEDNSVMYIAMRYVSNGTLRDYLRALGGPIDLNLAAKLVA